MKALKLYAWNEFIMPYETISLGARRPLLPKVILLIFLEHWLEFRYKDLMEYSKDLVWIYKAV